MTLFSSSKKSWRVLQDVLKDEKLYVLEDNKLLHWRHLQDVLETKKSLLVLLELYITIINHVHYCFDQILEFQGYFNPLVHNFPNGQTYIKNLAAIVTRFLKSVLPFWNITHLKVKVNSFLLKSCYTL